MAVSRVIEVSFGRSSVALVRVNTAYFYNNGIIFKPTDIELPTSYQVHWADSPQATSTLETIGTAEGAPIPDDLWNRSRVIYGWIYLHPTEDSGVTGYEVRIYKNVRAGLPDGTEPTPAEQSTIDQLIGALNSAVEQTGQDAESAQASAEAAESAKTAAESARDTAGEYANDAESSAASASTSASQASTSATASAQSASQSAQIKADIEDMVDDAQGYASASAQSASQASASEQGCARAVLDAASAAAIARARAEEASGYAQTASSKAQDASTSAQTASQKATEASQSASQALSYKTDAESAKTASQTAQGLAESARDSAVQAKTDAESAKADAESARDEAQQAVASISGALAEKAPIITDTASGSIASFSDGADDLPLKSLIVDINPIQDLSQGDPSPENICPISGWTQVQTNQSGANILNPVARTNSYYALAVGTTLPPLTRDYSDFANDTITIQGTTWVGNGFISEKAAVGRTYRITGTITSPTPRCAFVTTDANFKIVRIIKNIINSGELNLSVTIAEGESYIAFSLADATDGNIALVNPCISESGIYEPYTGQSITINLGQTVYGGKLDVLSGELVIDRAMVDLGTFDWAHVGEIFYSASAPLFGANGTALIDNAARNVCEIYKYETVPINNPVNGRFFVTNTQEIPVLRVSDNRFTDAVSLKSALDGIKAVFELYAPLTIQLTPTEVRSLLGQNNIWADSGDTTAEYRADTKLFIERLTAPDSADMIADANITSGQYFMVGNSLYKATANIANGAQIVVGTNCTRKSLSEALNEINA